MLCCVVCFGVLPCVSAQWNAQGISIRAASHCVWIYGVRCKRESCAREYFSWLSQTQQTTGVWHHGTRVNGTHSMRERGMYTYFFVFGRLKQSRKLEILYWQSFNLNKIRCTTSGGTTSHVCETCTRPRGKETVSVDECMFCTSYI